jgi:protein disulfide-isomerase A1
LERGLPLVWYFVDKASDATAQLLADAATLASEAKGSLSFVQLDGIRWADHAKNFGLSGSTPGVVIEDREDTKNYVFKQSDDHTLANLRTFVTGYLDGSLQPTVKSQEIPTDNNGPVKVVVGKTFDSIVLDDSKDVFVEFYAPCTYYDTTYISLIDRLSVSELTH